jgi:hypothetical protein
MACISFLLSSIPGLQQSLLAQERRPRRIIRKIKSFIEVQPEELRGLLLYSDEKTPVSSAPVRVWSTSENRFIYATRSTKRGAYRIPKLAEDFYYFIFADRVILEIVVDASSERANHPLYVIIPKGKPGLTSEQLSRMLSSEEHHPPGNPGNNPGHNPGGNPGRNPGNPGNPGEPGEMTGLLLRNFLVATGVAASIAIPIAIAGGFRDEDEEVRYVSP